MADQKIRSFLAIKLDDLLIQDANGFVTKIQSHYPQFRFIPPNNWHLTLHFLGSISAQEVDTLIKVLPEMASKMKPFSISLKGLGGFPGEKKSRILWIGVSDKTNRLMHLKETLDQVLIKMKFPIETRPYHPHITIARARNPAICPISGAEKNIEFAHNSWVEKITLFRSDLSSQGPQYTPLSEFLLNSSR